MSTQTSVKVSKDLQLSLHGETPQIRIRIHTFMHIHESCTNTQCFFMIKFSIFQFMNEKHYSISFLGKSIIIIWFELNASGFKLKNVHKFKQFLCSSF